MPSYVFEVASEQGVQRHSFTLDDDRPLGPQITQVLEELRQRGVVLRGGRDDALGVFWSGRELDLSKRTAEQGVTSAHPVELRMRERVVVALPTVDTGVPKGVLATAAWGYAGGFAAWLASGVWTDTGALLSSYARLDLAMMALLGGVVGASVLAGSALRTRGSIALALGAGLILGAAGAVASAAGAVLLAGAVSLRGFVVLRVLGWSVAAALSSVLLSIQVTGLEARRSSESLAIGLLSGAVAGVVFGLPGPSELWQAVACLAWGTGVGIAACGPALWHAEAIVEAAPRRRAPGVVGLREWAVDARRPVSLGGARVAWQGGRLALHPPATGVSVSGKRVTAPLYLDGGPVSLDGSDYLIRTPGHR